MSTTIHNEKQVSEVEGLDFILPEEFALGAAKLKGSPLRQILQK